MTTHSTHFDSPVGRLLALAANDAIIALHILGGQHPPVPAEPWLDSPRLPVFLQLRQELAEYFAGQRRRFELRLAPVGSDFQQAAWLALTRIPYGQTRSYGQQAAAIGRPAAVRAVAAANGRNPIAIVVPCHRVIAANGALTGYAGGLHNKALLLRLEGSAA